MSETFKKFPKLFQLDILSCLAQHRPFLRECLGILKPEYFEKDLYQYACESIYKVYLSTKQLPAKSHLLHAVTERYERETRVKSEDQRTALILRPVQKLLKKIYKPIEGSVEYVKQVVLKFCQVQEMKRSFLEGFEELQKNPEPEQVKAYIHKRLRNLSILDQGGYDFFKNIENLPGQLARDKGRCIKTGFKTLDRLMEGGMDPGTETVFMAPAKFGKSMVLVNVGFANLLRGKVVVYFTLEISEKKIMRRFTCRIARMAKMEENPGKAIRRVQKFSKMHRGKLFVKGYPTKTASVETLKSYLYGLQNKHDVKPDLILVDYGDLLRSYAYIDKTGDKERFVLGDVFEGLRAMAQEFDCALVTATQTNRAAASKPVIHMEDVAESYQKVQIADHIIALCGTDEERKKKRMRLFFAGSREAETHRSIRIKYNWPKSVMKEVRKKDREKQPWRN